MRDTTSLRLSNRSKTSRQKNRRNLQAILEEASDLYNRPSFIEKDPISIPHQYTRKEDIEITGFWTAIFSWGQRQTIINKAKALFALMDNAPHEFIRGHQEKDRERFAGFVHRTFQYTDTLYFLEFLQWFYRKHDSLEELFLHPSGSLQQGLIQCEQTFFSLPSAPKRTRKHISTPARKSTCKRINMFLRWMVRKDERGVDFGLWKRIKPHELYLPLDVHVERVARRLGLLKRKQRDWQAVIELTQTLRAFDATDPCRYDFALFGIGALSEPDPTSLPFA